MAKKVTKKAPVVETPVAPAPAPPPAPVVARGVAQPKEKKVKEPETAEVKWARRLARWSKKADAAGCDSKGLMRAFLGA